MLIEFEQRAPITNAQAVDALIFRLKFSYVHRSGKRILGREKGPLFSTAAIALP